ncbi:SAM-dependent methyltransferase [Leadbettera azotonutricia]|uniref:Ribosomal RNA large subunit methyltransferase E n=1 Tax=Leadbettera azotonutricia (strain ATCC BAA-888 / DSM 13862 / ZAS-9) TaxID=545695 RepID=F5YCH2_LEAAZ|nr:RlmE family RNA methyltransferase [Leadbettera azotonutricia]AEF83490.1 ribosomal RNA large subunit methyltransferase J [Leadbettera azotonutricia ZAS-9]
MANYEKLDFWSLKAQKEGYPARSVYKLKEMDEKFSLLKRGMKVLDLGAAPGSWSLYVLRKMAAWGEAANSNRPASTLVSIDLSPLSRVYDQGLFDSSNFFFIQGDMTSPENTESIFSRGGYNLLLSDAAPATTGNRSVDTLRSLGLAEMALHYAENALAQGGNMAVKVFQGGDTSSLLKKIRSLFESGKSFKPQACRPGSFETYYVGLGKKT